MKWWISRSVTAKTLLSQPTLSLPSPSRNKCIRALCLETYLHAYYPAFITSEKSIDFLIQLYYILPASCYWTRGFQWFVVVLFLWFIQSSCKKDHKGNFTRWLLFWKEGTLLTLEIMEKTATNTWECNFRKAILLCKASYRYWWGFSTHLKLKSNVN